MLQRRTKEGSKITVGMRCSQIMTGKQIKPVKFCTQEIKALHFSSSSKLCLRDEAGARFAPLSG
jgi:hypothetical protein